MGEPTFDRSYLTKIADDINYGVEGAGTYEKTVASGIRQTKYIPNLCVMAAIYKQRNYSLYIQILITNSPVKISLNCLFSILPLVKL